MLMVGQGRVIGQPPITLRERLLACLRYRVTVHSPCHAVRHPEELATKDLLNKAPFQIRRSLTTVRDDGLRRNKDLTLCLKNMI